MTMPWERPLTADDFFAMDTPDDGNRYELIDGVPVVSPSPFVPHQLVLGQLFVTLWNACPDELRSPTSWWCASKTLWPTD